MYKKIMEKKVIIIIFGIILIVILGSYYIYKRSNNIVNNENQSTQTMVPNDEATDTSIQNETTTEEDIRSEIHNLDKETEKWLFGEWKISKFIQITAVHNDKANWPNGQDIINEKFVFTKTHFYTEKFEKYPVYQVDFINPVYKISLIDYYRGMIYSGPGINDRETLNILENEEVYKLDVYDEDEKDSGSFSLYLVSSHRIILTVDCAVFELEKVK